MSSSIVILEEDMTCRVGRQMARVFLTHVGERVIALFAAHKQARQSARRNDFDFDMVPAAIGLNWLFASQ